MRSGNKAIISTFKEYLKTFNPSYTCPRQLASDPEASIIISGLNDVIYNSIFIKNPTNTDALVQELQDFQKALAKPLTIWTTAETMTPGLDNILARHFVTPGAFYGMLLDLDEVNLESQQTKIIIEPIENDIQARTYAKVLCEIFAMQDLSPIFAPWTLHMYNPDKSYCLNYLAKINHVIAGVCTLVIDKSFEKFKTGGFYHACVLPEFRNKGVATAMANYRIRIAKELGLQYLSIILEADAMAKGYCDRLGFKHYQSMTPYYII